MPDEGDSYLPNQTRREFIGTTCPMAGLGVTTSRVFSKRNTTRDLVSDFHANRSTQFHSGVGDFRDFPDDPFIVPVGNRWFSHRSDLIGSWVASDDLPYVLGYEPTTLSQKIRTVIGLHLDALSTNGLDDFVNGRLKTTDPVTDVPRFGRQTGIPTSVGWNFTLNLDDPVSRYGPIMEEEGWTYPDGTPVEHPRALLSKTYDGDIRPIHRTRGIPSAYAPGVRDLLVRATEQRITQGFTGFFVDGSGSVFLKGPGLDFSVWTTTAFQDHLSSLSRDRLTELGIDEPETFDIRSHLEEEDLAPDADTDPRADPIFREYVLHNHLGIKGFFETYREAVNQRFPERREQGEIKLWPNQFMGNFEPPQAPHIYVSDSFDIMHVEMWPTVQPGVGFKYKLLRAMGRFSKPVMGKGTLASFDLPRIDEFDPSVPYRMLQRFLMAEAYANGAILKPALTAPGPVDQALTNWIQADGAVPDELQSFIDFVWAHRRFLQPEEVESDVQCAVVMSLPTRIWRYFPPWGIGGPGESPRLDSFVGTVRLLREAQIPYDVIVFGHSRLWGDAEQLDRLKGYDAVVLPGVECLSQAQVTTIAAYLDSAGAVVTSGPPPERDEMFVPDDDVVAVMGRDEVTVLADDPGHQRAITGESEGSLVEALVDHGIEPVTDESDPTLAVNRMTQPAESRTVVHLLNYDYAPKTDAFTPKDDVTLRLRTPEHEVTVARYFSPQRIIDLDFSAESGRIELTVPELVEWGFIVLASSPDALVDAAAESDARESIERGNRLVDEARESDRDWGPDFAVATTKLDSAMTATEYDAYAQAERAASEAIAAIENTYPRPVVGVDLSHNQSSWQQPSHADVEVDVPFGWLEENFEPYHFEMLESWNQAELDSIDVILVPPALESFVSSFGFESSELDRIEQFVSDGGSIVIIGDWRATRDIDELTDRFGFRFLGPKIQFPKGVWGLAPTTPEHPLTQAIDAIPVANGTPIERLPGNAEVLARVPEDSQAWLSTEPPRQERNEGEPSAAGAPIFAHAMHGVGHVVVLSSPNFAFSPDDAPSMEVMYNILAFLGQESGTDRENERNDMTTPTTASGTSTPPTPSHETGTATPETVTTTDGQSGFSAVIGVIGILGGIAHHVHRACKDPEEQ